MRFGLAREWSEWLELDGGDAIASYTSGVLAGRPAVIRNAVGRAALPTTAPPASTRPGSPRSSPRPAPTANVSAVADVPAGVEACRRSSESGSYLFLLNHTEHEVEVELPPTADLVLGANPLAPLGVAIVREP